MAHSTTPEGQPPPISSGTPAFAVNRHGTVTAAPPATSAELPSLGTVCAAATWYRSQETLLRHGEVAEFGREFAACLDRLVPEIEKLARDRDPGDTEATMALAAVVEARKRMSRREADGLKGEAERVDGLALSVTSLVYHHEKLSGDSSSAGSSTR
ncbi:hypothetical protein DF268_36090 [Streptomyces sp. V2]|uniref:DUF6415 family natural product biosynthesis protein n=1 Tax=Streptomyces sp. V2 TaxID=1424099 RepID=UPI000D671D00|nr:DUF6415 family natural product biosynthesis protein [Streptomyces sp. V2]PWG08793.1 hypothetical protein DF268_36090 [Streptomyces sp. V2]